MKIKPEHWVFVINAGQMLANGESPESVKASMRALDFDAEQCDEMFAEASMVCLDLKVGITPKRPDWAK